MSPAAESNLSKELVRAKSGVYRFSVVIEKDKDGYFAFAPELQGCYTQGDSGEGVPQPEFVSLTSVEVAV
jgi:hypothetical protein